MIPIKSANKTKIKGFPFINILLILACIAVFIYELKMPPSKLEHFFYAYGVVPDLILKKMALIDSWAILYPYITSIFVHAGWLHIIGNMVFLAIFGGDVEKTMGHFKYLLFFIVCGITAGIINTAMDINSAIPTVGASGAIAGILGAYFVLFPRSKITTVMPLIVISPIIEIPALIFLGLWFVLQYLSANSGGGTAPVAWWAHIGGFIAGMGFALTMFRKK